MIQKTGENAIGTQFQHHCGRSGEKRRHAGQKRGYQRYQQPAGSALVAPHSPTSLATRATATTPSIAYIRLEKAIAAGESSINFEREDLRVTLAEFKAAREALDNRPEYSGLVSSWSWSSYTSGPLAGCVASTRISYRASAAQIQEMLAGPGAVRATLQAHV